MTLYKHRRVFLVGGLLGVAVLLVVLFLAAPPHPVARIQVVDAAGNPICGAIVQPQGLRTKPGPYRSGWYGWSPESRGVSNAPAITDEDGYVSIPYPRYVFERIETGVLCLEVRHPDYVSDRPERDVAAAPPVGAPFKAYVDYVLARLRRQIVLSKPIVLQKGAVLEVSAPDPVGQEGAGRLFVQVADLPPSDTNTWHRPRPGLVVTRTLGAGPHTIRAVLVQSNGLTRFSDVIPIVAVTEQTNSLHMNFGPGVTLRGEIDSNVQRPIRNGRVVVQIWPVDSDPARHPPVWHAWSRVRDDGTFEIPSLPAGDLELVAMCQGFVSSSRPGLNQTIYPQKHSLGTNDLTVSIQMKPTARLEVRMVDQQGEPVEGARVFAWPNVRYGEWASTIVMSDLYNTLDTLNSGAAVKPFWERRVPDLEGVSDASGVAVLPNLPANVARIGIEHPDCTLPVVVDTMGRKSREATVNLTPGETNRIQLQLEPCEASQISHY